MKYFGRPFVAVFGVSISLLTSLHAQQPWSGIISSSRGIDWTKAGLPASFTDKGGSNVETTVNPWTPPSRTQSGSTISPSGSASTDLSNINTALSNCTDGHYVLLGSGTFQIQGIIVMYQHSCSLRGSGPMSTTISMTGAGVIYMGADETLGACVLTTGSNFAAGATSVACNGLSGTAPTVGDIVSLNQCDTGYSGTLSGTSMTCTGTSADNGGLYICGDNNACQQASNTGNNEHQHQNFIITSASNSGGTYTIGLSSSTYMPNWSFALSAYLNWNAPQYNGIGVGVEDMTVYYTGSSSVNEDVQMDNTYASWVKGVRFIGAAQEVPLSVNISKNALIMNNYMFSDIALDSNYPAAMNFGTNSDTLVLNNAMTSGVPWEGYGGNAGNVFAYNYARDTFTMYVENNFFDHRAYSSFDLSEGNETGVLQEDSTWGTHGLNTYFRNYVSCWDPPYSTLSPRGLVVDAYQRFENLIGNAVGNLNQCPTYQGNISSTGINFRIDTTDPLVASTLLRWGNVSVVHQSTDTPANSGVRFVSSEVPTSLSNPIASFSLTVPSNDNLPCSFFLTGTSTSCTPTYSGGTGLSWWKVCKTWNTFPTSCATTQTQPFPIAGPDITGGSYVNGYAYDIPAAIAWQNLPVDTTYQNSYTITGSSYSRGTETLTVSGPPNVTHLMGAFQLTGVTSACTTGATFGNNSEVLMTGSSSTTVQYALASNPGVSCTGTMKFPDVRQFDERVYECDAAASGSPGCLTGALVKVH